MVGTYHDLERSHVVDRRRVTTAVRRVQDLMRMDPGVDGDAQRLAQLVLLLFLREVDAEDKRRSQTTGRARVMPTGTRWEDWAEGAIPDRDLIQHLNDEALPALRQLGGPPSGLGRLISAAISDVQNSMTSGALLREVTQQLHFLNPDEQPDRHLLGDIYEQLLSGLREAGNAGEFYTPRAVTSFVAEMLDVRPGESVIDPASGTAGFLTSVLETSRKRHGGDPDLYGIEKKPLPHLLSLTNLLIHGVAAGGRLVRGNGLDTRIGPAEGFDVVVTNPPFGGSEEDGVVQIFPPGFRTRETADLFVYTLMGRLRKGGRGAVVLPDGLLFGSGARRRIREELLRRCSVETVVRLPEGVFSPYTDIKTNILFFSKTESTKGVWFVEQSPPAGAKRFTRRNPLTQADMQPIRQWWSERETTSFAWRTAVAELSEHRLDPDNPHRSGAGLEPSAAADAFQAAVQQGNHVASELARDLAQYAPDLWRIIEPSWSSWTSNLAGVQQLPQMLLSAAGKGLFSGGANDLATEALPFGWRLVPIAEIGRVVAGATPKTDDPANFSEAGIPWVTPADLRGLSGKYVKRGKRDLSELGLSSCSARLLPEGAVLFSSRAPIGYTAIAANPMATNQGFKSVVPFNRSDADFLYYALRAWVPKIERAARGTTFKEVPARQMNATTIPWPPEEERVRLAGLLDSIIPKTEEVARLCKQVVHVSEAGRGAVLRLVS